VIVAATGHRPDKLGGYDMKTRRALGGLAVEWLRYKQPDQVVSGMALGWDQAVAAACVMLDIPFIAAIPFWGQEERWPQEAQDRYRRLRSCASVEVYVLDQAVVSQHDAVRALQQRNEWMVDYAQREDPETGKVLALWNGTMGGTHNCIRYAEKKGVAVTNLWLDWSLPAETLALLS
jgi:uncharacterized phage-like protein YoqJ